MRIGFDECAIALALTLTAQFALADTPATYALRGQSSFVEKAGRNSASFRIVNTTYAVTEASISDPDKAEQVLIEQRSVWRQDWDTDSTIPDMAVTARVISKDGFRKALWAFHERADHGEVWRDYYYRTTLLGREGDDNIDTYHNISTGQAEFLATGEPILVDLGGGGPAESGIIYYLSGQGCALASRYPDTAFGLLVMQQGAQVIDRVMFVGDGHAIEGWNPKIGAVDKMTSQRESPDGQQELTLSKRQGMTDAQAWSGFDVRLSYEDAAGRPLIEIPVKDGRFAIDGVTLPQGVSLRRDLSLEGGPLCQ